MNTGCRKDANSDGEEIAAHILSQRSPGVLAANLKDWVKAGYYEGIKANHRQ